MRRVPFPAPRCGRKADGERIFERDGGVCQGLAEHGLCCRDLRALAAEIVRLKAVGDLVAFLGRLGLSPRRPLWEIDHITPLWSGGADVDENSGLPVLSRRGHARRGALAPAGRSSEARGHADAGGARGPPSVAAVLSRMGATSVRRTVRVSIEAGPGCLVRR